VRLDRSRSIGTDIGVWTNPPRRWERRPILALPESGGEFGVPTDTRVMPAARQGLLLRYHIGGLLLWAMTHTLWLEVIDGEQAPLDWVGQRNKATLAELCGERFERMRAEALEVVDSDDRIPSVKRRGEYLYNFWTDAEHRRGVWRRTTLDEYRKDSPNWDVVLDVDALAAAEDENWVWAGADVIEPEYTPRADQSVAWRFGRGGGA